VLSAVFGCDPGMKSIQDFHENCSELSIPSVLTEEIISRSFVAERKILRMSG